MLIKLFSASFHHTNILLYKCNMSFQFIEIIVCGGDIVKFAGKILLVPGNCVGTATLARRLML